MGPNKARPRIGTKMSGELSKFQIVKSFWAERLGDIKGLRNAVVRIDIRIPKNILELVLVPGVGSTIFQRGLQLWVFSLMVTF